MTRLTIDILSLIRLHAARAATLVVALGLLGCGGDDPTGPESSVESLVGDWQATALVVTADADPTSVVDLIDEGARFSINVQPSGQYTAVLVILGFPQTEIGTIRIEGDEIVFTREFPSSDTSRAAFSQSGNKVTLEGATQFDFGGGNGAESGVLRTELTRVEG